MMGGPCNQGFAHHCCGPADWLDDMRISSLAFVVGVVAAVAGVSLTGSTRPATTLGVGLTLTMTGPSEATVDAPQPLAVISALVDDPSRAATAIVRNISGRTMALDFRALPSTGVLDELVDITITAGGDSLYEGRLSDLRRWTSNPVVLRRGAVTQLVVGVRLDGLEADIAEADGALETVAIDLRATPIGASA